MFLKLTLWGYGLQSPLNHHLPSLSSIFEAYSIKRSHYILFSDLSTCHLLPCPPPLQSPAHTSHPCQRSRCNCTIHPSSCPTLALSSNSPYLSSDFFVEPYILPSTHLISCKSTISSPDLLTALTNSWIFPSYHTPRFD